MPDKSTANITRARQRWGDAAPEWIVVLADHCDRVGQSAAGKTLGISGAQISQALSNSYPGRLDKLELKVRGELMKEGVQCPVLGAITKRHCLDEQSRPFASTNALRVELRRACPRCPNCIRRVV